MCKNPTYLDIIIGSFIAVRVPEAIDRQNDVTAQFEKAFGDSFNYLQRLHVNFEDLQDKAAALITDEAALILRLNQLTVDDLDTEWRRLAGQVTRRVQDANFARTYGYNVAERKMNEFIEWNSTTRASLINAQLALFNIPRH